MSKEEMNQGMDQIVDAVNKFRDDHKDDTPAQQSEKPVSTTWKIVGAIAPPMLILYGATCLFTCGQVARELYSFIVNAGLVYFGWNANIAYRLFRRSRRKA